MRYQYVCLELKYQTWPLACPRLWLFANYLFQTHCHYLVVLDLIVTH
jgi:hypothetical protein